MRHWLVLILFLLGLGTLRVVACGEDSCVENEDCDYDNPCTRDWCPEPLLTFDISLCGADDERTCQHSWLAFGTPCGSGKVCVGGNCGENLCEDVDCDDDDACTDGTCDYVNGLCDFTSVVCHDGDKCTEDICNPLDGLCDYTTPAEDGTTCDHEEGLGICSAGACVGPCDPGSNQIYPCPVSFGFNDYAICCPGREYCTQAGIPCDRGGV